MCLTIWEPAAAAQRQISIYWRDGGPASGFDLGTRSPINGAGSISAQPVWRLVSGTDAQGQPRPVPGQFNIFSVQPGDAGYTDLWRVIDVEVPPTYRANSAKSAEDLTRAGYPQTPTAQLVNCPFVAIDDALGTRTDRPHQGWVGGKPVWYFDLGPASATAGTVWEFTTDDPAAGTPSPVPGQPPVTDASAAAFRRLVWVRVPTGFRPGSIRTVNELRRAGYPATRTNLAVNLASPPQARTAASAPRRVPSTGGGLRVYVAVGAYALVFLAATLYIVRRSE
ncbi:MAG: hypothetical protein KGJ86_06130 [Chloroflexota bacterium]|nr:hypothetical protein [Chloroflexota bacterium]